MNEITQFDVVFMKAGKKTVLRHSQCFFLLCGAGETGRLASKNTIVRMYCCHYLTQQEQRASEMNLCTKNKQTHRQREQICGCQEGGSVEEG